MLIDPKVERGCLITTNFSIIPFENIAEHPLALIEMGVEGFNAMTDLAMRRELYGWAHSHPHWKPYPSPTDINCHKAAMTMVIYSICYDEFGIYDNDEVNQLNPEGWSNRPGEWKKNVTDLMDDKELITGANL